MIRNHPRANDWRGKLCSYYEDLYIIFGKDYASGKDAQGPEEMEDEVNEEEENKESSKKDEPESSSTQEPSRVESTLLVETSVELSALIEKHSKLNEELANLGLTKIERHQVARKITFEPESVDVFSVSLMSHRKSGCKLFFEEIFKLENLFNCMIIHIFRSYYSPLLMVFVLYHLTGLPSVQPSSSIPC
ncbi:hypothetical protein Cgig2_010204 [Carnegiea gigantea]|uniref:Uncharacterized protein n=1 Tax=Carnegiea gigantea TaxID=171969 RepID=A0A9Q1GVP0_9CARY|nr:hypothetical protein Cgig2_010204 [Carnegiea gigantea]